MCLLVNQLTVEAMSTGSAIVGTSYTFDCSVTPPSGVTVSSYQWTNPSDVVVSSGSSLTINPVSVNDAGTYTCTVVVTNSSAYIVVMNPHTGTAKLTVNGKYMGMLHVHYKCIVSVHVHVYLYSHVSFSYSDNQHNYKWEC